MMKPRSIIIVNHRASLITNSGCEKTKQGLSLQKRIKKHGKFCMRYFSFSMKKIVQILVQNGKTITDKFYDSVLSKVEADYEKHRPATGLRGLCLIHDNAPAHKCVLVQDFMKEDKVVHLSHPPYSPD